MFCWCPKTWGVKKIHVASILEFKLPLEILLDLLQPIQADLSLQVNLRPLQIVSNVSSCQKTWVLKKPKSLACLEVELLLEVLLDLLQPIQAVLSLQVNLRPLEIVPNDSPYPKTWGLKKIQDPSSPGSQVTTRSSPWPPTAHTGCSWPSGQSEATGIGPKWFPIPKNLVGFEKKSSP